MTHRQMHEHTWNSLRGNWSRSVGVLAAALGLIAASVFIILIFMIIPPIGILVYFGAIFFFVAPLIFGVNQSFWNIVTTGQTRVGSIFTFFRNGAYLRSVGLFSLLFLICMGISIVAMLPLMIVAFAFVFQFASGLGGMYFVNPDMGDAEFYMFFSQLLNSNLQEYLVAFVLCYLFLLAAIVVTSMFFFPVPFVLMAHPGMKPARCISWGSRSTRGFKGRFLLCLLEYYGFFITLGVVTTLLRSVSPYFNILSVAILLVFGVSGGIYFSTLVATLVRVALDVHMPMPQAPVPPVLGGSAEFDAKEFIAPESVAPEKQEEEAPAPNPLMQPGLSEKESLRIYSEPDAENSH